MSDKSMSQKLSLKPGGKFLLVDPPPGYIARMGDLPQGAALVSESSAPVQAIQVFVANRAALEALLPRLKGLLSPNGMLWITYHKGTSKIKTDINRDSIVAYARTMGLQGVAMISIDEDWAALRLKLIQA